jgi:FMN phosphatase YigB (HAD superfamily)
MTFILFDAYGTLVELDDFVGKLQRGFAQDGLQISAEDITFAARREMRYYVDNAVRAADEENWLQVRSECAQVIAETLTERGHEVPNAARVLTILGDAIVFRPFPETRELLQELNARGIPCAVLSNWDFKLPQHFAAIDLLRHFQFVVSSAEVGEAKPSPLMFARALEKCREYSPEISAADCLYVGDDYENDVVGARDFGMEPFYVVRENRVASLSEIAKNDDAPKLSSLLQVLNYLD